MPFPEIDPVAFCLGPLAIRWYALAYLGGIFFGWRLLRRIVSAPGDPVGRAPVDAMMNAGIIGIIIGGRLAYVLFYNPYDDPFHYFKNPLEIIAVWQGGMSFHGGFLGICAAVIYVARRYGLPILALADIIALASTIGLFFGRIANFINGELYGRVTDAPWGVVFKRPPWESCSGEIGIWQIVPPGLPRHPSQLYEAGLEGALLFIILYAVCRAGGRARPGLMVGIFLLGYGASRVLVEFVREPDAQLGFLFGGVTMGQILSTPMVIIGVIMIMIALARSPQAQSQPPQPPQSPPPSPPAQPPQTPPQ